MIAAHPQNSFDADVDHDALNTGDDTAAASAAALRVFQLGYPPQYRSLHDFHDNLRPRMLPRHGLETPPPSSRFRRPWSPEPFDPNLRDSVEPAQRAVHGDALQRREASDYSVEALDLADYALTLARQGHAQTTPAFQPYDLYPPSPRPYRTISTRASTSTPPLLSPSASTSQAHTDVSSRSSVPPRPTHRPFSFPAPTAHPSSTYSYPTHTNRYSAAHDHDPLRTPPSEPDTEIDIAQFPAFARGWYPKPAAPSPELARYARFPGDPFDPSYQAQDYTGYATPPPLYAPHAARSVGTLPWGTDALGDGPVDAQVKEERIRMLEREFANAKPEDEDEEHIVGSVDSKGRLITSGPKKRALVRWFQTLLALMAGGSGIYAAAVRPFLWLYVVLRLTAVLCVQFIKPPSPAPPAGKPPAYLLYILSVITFLLTAYLFILYPMCCGPRKRKAAAAQFTGGSGGMMVMPVQGVPGGNPKKKGKKGAKEGGGDVQVNLIVDPGLFNGELDDDGDDETSESEYTVPGSYSGRSNRTRRQRRAAKRRSIFAGLALEAQWRHARKMLKWGMAVDIIMVFVWGAEFVYILIGKRCPSGSFNGW